MCIYMYTYNNIYIYRERERYVSLSLYLSIYLSSPSLYIHIYIYTYQSSKQALRAQAWGRTAMKRSWERILQIVIQVDTILRVYTNYIIKSFHTI